MGSFVTPYLRKKYELRVLDLRPPKHPGIEYVEGSITDPQALQRALEGVDTFINMVMKNPTGGREATLEDIVNNYQVNTLGLHLLLYTAKNLCIKRGVHTSTTTVHDRPRSWYFSMEEEVPLYNSGVYGLTKGFGELICRYFCREFDMNIIALRITGPRTREQWLAEFPRPKPIPNGGHLWPADEEDLANAYMAALEAVQVGHGRFDAIYIAGDVKEQEINLTKARRILGWEPRTHLKVPPEAFPPAPERSS